ncbi:hypothetical protein GCM10010500_76820 [Streptomyces nigrescens]|nr:hypothetical protein GCM10010500_76820 [Streptomyces libani subsp. libani]
MSTGSSSGRDATWDARRPACAASASRDRADSIHGTIPGADGAAAGASSGAGGSASSVPGTGACSSTTCALVPLIPKEDTPARRGRPESGHSRARVSSSTAPADQSTCGEGSSTCRVFGSVPCRMARTIFITPATPAAAWVCPMFDLIEPSQSGWSCCRSCPYVASSACASIGSPSRVPVPCASTASTSPVDSRALASACRITRCCAGPFGAVRPLLAPSWLTAEPRTTARIGCPLRWASDSRSTSSTPAPSPQPVPSAAAAKDLQRPSAARPRCREKSMKVSGVNMTVTPPASAMLHSPARRA